MTEADVVEIARRIHARDVTLWGTKPEAQSIANKHLLEENDAEAREKRLKELEFTATDEKAKREYLLRASLVQMVEEADAIQ